MKCPEMLLLPEIDAAAAGELRLDVWSPARPERDGPHHRHVGVDVSWGSLRESAACSAFASSLASSDGGRSVTRPTTRPLPMTVPPAGVTTIITTSCPERAHRHRIR